MLAFLLLYRFAEAQLVKLIVPFLLDPAAQGGLGLTTQQVGIAYGFGFTAYMVFMLQVAARAPEGGAGDNPHKTAHYALCTGFMALGMMLPGMWSGWLQEALGYTAFFVWCCVATLPGFAAAAWVRIDGEGGGERAAGSPRAPR